MRKIQKTVLFILVAGCFILGISITAIRDNLSNNDYSEYSLHISVDDTIDLFSDLTKNEAKYNSIFDNDTLAFCKEMHDKYGAVFSFYVFSMGDGFELKDCTEKFKSEFINNFDWLKFNFHSYNSSENLNDISISIFQSEYSESMNYLIKVVGEESIDSATRLTMFSGSKEVLNCMSKDTVIFYTADDSRNSYYFNKDISQQIYVNEKHIDNNLTFIKTDLRLDNTESPFNDMLNLINNGTDKNIEVFTHEWLLKQGSIKSQSIWKIREVCRFAFYYKLRFAFN